MPELPEVETMRRGVAPVVRGRFQQILVPRSPYKPYRILPELPDLRRRIVRRRIEAVDRIGKRVVFRLDDASALVFEPRMTGLLLVANPPNRHHIRLRIKISQSPVDEIVIWDRRGLGSVYWLSPGDVEHRLGPEAIGPDAADISATVLRQRLQRLNREIKVALLDQKVVSGIGNLYASEILHVAGIHPQDRCGGLRVEQWQALHRATRSVLKTAIRLEGSTLSDGTYRTALNQSGSYQLRHRVYDRADAPCVTCGKGIIVRIVQGQRSTFFCPRCQRA